MSDVAIKVENLGKCYRLRHETGRPRYRTLRDDLIDGPRRLWRAMRTRRGRTQEAFWALKDVSFEVKRGEVLGIIGRNGAGKSTLLKIISRIVEPTTGAVDIYGRVGSLLEVGTGFHPELTGRENIFLSGAMLGMRRHEVRARLDEIVAFAEVEKFLDTPCKHYSSGMYTRLGFAVAAHLDADILAVDEVLAVGDAEFQKRCIRKMESIAGTDGRTILFVSHNIAAVRQLCSQALYLKAGMLDAAGSVDQVLQRYATELGTLSTELIRELSDDKLCGVEFIRLHGVRSVDQGAFASGKPIALEVGVNVLRAFRTIQVAVRISTREGMPVLTTTNFDATRRTVGLSAGRHSFSLTIPPLFAPGDYTLTVAVCDPRRESFDLIEDGVGFSIDEVGSLKMDLNDGRKGCVELSLCWKHEALA
jgi:lipopolysaccharide transport system ATP-binding protein